MKLPFDEVQVLTENLPHLKRSLGYEDISVHSAASADVPEGVVDADGPLPGEPKPVLDVESA